jgi:hypothetical protein
MTNQIMRRLEKIEALMDPDKVPKVRFILRFVSPADGDQPEKVECFRFHGMGNLERVNRDGSPWEGDSDD